MEGLVKQKRVRPNDTNANARNHTIITIKTQATHRCDSRWWTRFVAQGDWNLGIYALHYHGLTNYHALKAMAGDWSSLRTGVDMVS
jgi:hypothetical protein